MAHDLPGHIPIVVVQDRGIEVVVAGHVGDLAPSFRGAVVTGKAFRLSHERTKRKRLFVLCEKASSPIPCSERSNPHIGFLARQFARKLRRRQPWKLDKSDYRREEGRTRTH
jgi:hypothetical protein